MITKEAATIAAKRGIEKLDEDRAGWREEVQLPLLNMGNYNTCVLGQLFDDFIDGKNELDLTDGDAVELGFLAPSDGHDDCTAEYEVLTEVWLELLNE